MASNGQTGFGVKLGYRPVGSPNGTAYVNLGTVMKVSPPKITIGEVESTLLASTFKTYLPTIPEGESGFQLRLDPADPGVIAFKTAVSNAPIPTYSWQVLYTDNTSDIFDAFPKSFEPEDYEVESLMTASITLRLVTPSTFVPAPTS